MTAKLTSLTKSGHITLKSRIDHSTGLLLITIEDSTVGEVAAFSFETIWDFVQEVALDYPANQTTGRPYVDGGRRYHQILLSRLTADMVARLVATAKRGDR